MAAYLFVCACCYLQISALVAVRFSSLQTSLREASVSTTPLLRHLTTSPRSFFLPFLSGPPAENFPGGGPKVKFENFYQSSFLTSFFEGPRQICQRSKQYLMSILLNFYLQGFKTHHASGCSGFLKATNVLIQQKAQKKRRTRLPSML